MKKNYKDALIQKISIIFFAILCWFSGPISIKALKVGDLAPYFSLKNDANQIITLKDFYGKDLVLFFYPKDNTPECIKEACSIRHSYHFFHKNNVAIVGINYDSPTKHALYKKKYNLPFMLLSDTDGSIAKAFGAWSHWWHYFAPMRITFIIDQFGIIKHILSSIDVTSHAEDIKNLLNK